MLKNILIFILILLVIGLYFAPDITRGVLGVTGNAVKDVTKNMFDEVKDSDEVKNLTKEAKNHLEVKISEL